MDQSADSDEDFDIMREESRGKRFCKASIVEISKIENGCRRYSEGTDRWCERSFQEWQAANRITDTRSIAERHADQENLITFVQELARFVLETRPKTGGLIRQKEQQVAVQAGQPYIPFKILTDPRYALVVNAGDEAVRRSISVGIGRQMKKSLVLTVEHERMILGQKMVQIDTTQGDKCFDVKTVY
ncbi:hypothetical protein R1sor_002291 [Riccia sorocarpa]|uniref:Uncharacterized protein n=1 Tax=Riccia sorocarpa TaxID=122646 RepID=A0ABD3H126_9MARC